MIRFFVSFAYILDFVVDTRCSVLYLLVCLYKMRTSCIRNAKRDNRHPVTQRLLPQRNINTRLITKVQTQSKAAFNRVFLMRINQRRL